MITTLQNIIDVILRQVPAPLAADTVDTLKFGNPAERVQGVVVTFMATYQVLERAIALGANLIITHEPTSYNGPDETAWLKDDSVYLAKQKLIADHNLAIWRFHDGCHCLQPDGIVAGVVEQLGWSSQLSQTPPYVFTLPSLSVRELAQTCKQRLDISMVRVAGNLEAPCMRIGLLVGAYGGAAQIQLFQQALVDVVICGESPEWETCEYVRDATAVGFPKALIVLGHANSEEAGMAWIARWLRPLISPQIPIHHLAASDPFHFV